ncbi:MAG TPA: hypothetical protein VEI98_10025 [Xanthobacteraceae bacterium]|nr:hypothetical protein [Xanthobacteraceae bacterium]
MRTVFGASIFAGFIALAAIEAPQSIAAQPLNKVPPAARHAAS